MFKKHQNYNQTPPTTKTSYSNSSQDNTQDLKICKDEMYTETQEWKKQTKKTRGSKR